MFRGGVIRLNDFGWGISERVCFYVCRLILHLFWSCVVLEVYFVLFTFLRIYSLFL